MLNKSVTETLALDAQEDKNWLMHHVDPIDEVKDKWLNSLKLRRQEILAQENSNTSYLSRIFQAWPLFKHSIGKLLVSIWSLYKLLYPILHSVL